MSIELVYGFAEPDVSKHIAEEELLVDYGISLYSLEISNGLARKPFYGIPVNLDSKIQSGEQITINSDITGFLSQDDLESIDTLYYKVSEYNSYKPIGKPGLQIVYSTSFKFVSETQTYSLRSISDKTNQDNTSNTDALEQMMKQAQTHIEEQVSNQKKVIEYLKSIQEESRYKFELAHNLPPKNFMSNGKITPELELKIYDESELVYHVKLQTSGHYDLANGFVGAVDLTNILVGNFIPDEDFLAELESWAYLYDDGSIFGEVSEPLITHLRDLVKE